MARCRPTCCIYLVQHINYTVIVTLLSCITYNFYCVIHSIFFDSWAKYLDEILYILKRNWRHDGVHMCVYVVFSVQVSRCVSGVPGWWLPYHKLWNMSKHRADTSTKTSTHGKTLDTRVCSGTCLSCMYTHIYAPRRFDGIFMYRIVSIDRIAETLESSTL